MDLMWTLEPIMPLPETETHQLLLAVRSGDRSAGDALVRRFEPRLRTYLRRRSGPAIGQTVDDLFQETQIEALRSLPTFTYRAEGSYLAWLYTIARRVLARAWEKSNRTPAPMRFEIAGGPELSTRHLVQAMVAHMTGPLERVERNERAEIVTQALAELSDRHRQALVLTYLEGLKGPAAADVMGVRHDALRALLTRARRALVQVLDDALKA